MWKIVIALIMIFVSIGYANKVVIIDDCVIKVICIENLKFVLAKQANYGGISIVQMLDKNGKPQVCEGD